MKEIFNRTNPSKGPSSVIQYLRVGLLRSHIRHRLLDCKDLVESNPNRLIRKLGNIRIIIVPTWKEPIENLVIINELFPEAFKLVGPNFNFSFEDFFKFNFDNDSRVRLMFPSIEVIDYFRARYNEHNKIDSYAKVFPSTVDEKFWNIKNVQRERILVYKKYKNDGECDDILQSLRLRYGNRLLEISYGEYDRNSFRQVLEQVKYCVYLGGTESQGLALLEMWSYEFLIDYGLNRI